MIKFICIEILTIVLVSIICFYINIKDKKIKKNEIYCVWSIGFNSAFYIE